MSMHKMQRRNERALLEKMRPKQQCNIKHKVPGWGKNFDGVGRKDNKNLSWKDNMKNY